MLSVNALECARGERTLFSGLSFTLPPHTLLEVRGANGSGKTTLLRALCGLFVPTEGAITWGNADIRELGETYRGKLAYLGHLNAIKDDLTAVENLHAAARLAGQPADDKAVMAALVACGLAESRYLPCKLLSQGQRRRVALARLQLCAARPLWILDEPFSALDAAAVELTRSTLEAHLERGGLVVLTTHQEVPLRARSRLRIELTK